MVSLSFLKSTVTEPDTPRDFYVHIILLVGMDKLSERVQGGLQ